MTTNTSKDIIPSAKYQQASIRFREAWLEYLDKEGLVKYEIVNMVKVLEADGYTRTAAIQKIVDDHKDLKGFSRRTIYRELPDSMKRDYSLTYHEQEKPSNDEKDTNKDYYVPNDTFNNLQNNDENDVNITTSYDVKNAETINNTSDNGDNIEDENIENVEDSDNYNPQDILKIQQKTNSNPITNNNILPWYEQKSESEQLEQEIDLPSEKIYGIINWHLEMIIDEYRKLWIEINRMIRKMHKEYPEWKLDRIIYAIYESHEETKNYIPFNPAEIKKHLDTENKDLFGIYKKDKPIQNMKSLEDMR